MMTSSGVYEKKTALHQYLEKSFGRDVDICTEKYIKPYFKNQIFKAGYLSLKKIQLTCLGSWMLWEKFNPLLPLFLMLFRFTMISKLLMPVLMNFIVIGETLKKISAEFKTAHPHISWRKGCRLQRCRCP